MKIIKEGYLPNKDFNVIRFTCINCTTIFDCKKDICDLRKELFFGQPAIEEEHFAFNCPLCNEKCWHVKFKHKKQQQ